MHFFCYSPGIYREMGGPRTGEAYVGALLDGDGPFEFNVLLLKKGTIVKEPAHERPTALLVLDGMVWIATNTQRYDLHKGRGAICAPGEPYSMGSQDGSLVLAMEARRIIVHADCQLISTEQLQVNAR